ncbi:MAG: hypothetical protein ACREV7_02635 [Steroidobacteraceae bacterium]
MASRVLARYLRGEPGPQRRLVGLYPNHNLAFEFEYPVTYCDTSGIARPIGLDDLTITR